MSETGLLSKVWREYLRSCVAASELKDMDLDVGAGEPHSALEVGLNVANLHSIALPPVFVEKIESLPLLLQGFKTVYHALVSSLPDFWHTAS